MGRLGGPFVYLNHSGVHACKWERQSHTGDRHNASKECVRPPKERAASQSSSTIVCSECLSVIGRSCHKCHFCRDKPCLLRQVRVMCVVTKYFCRDKTRLFWRQNYASIIFVATNVFSRNTCFCRDKRRVLSRQTRVCSDRTFVAAKIILVAAPANDIVATSTLLSRQKTVLSRQTRVCRDKTFGSSCK